MKKKDIVGNFSGKSERVSEFGADKHGRKAAKRPASRVTRSIIFVNLKRVDLGNWVQGILSVKILNRLRVIGS